MARKWESEAEVAPGILRVRSGTCSAWFLVDGDEADFSADWADPAPERGELSRVDGSSCAGIVVARQEGGMLVDSLRRHSGLSSEQTIGVLLECLTALDRLPDPPPGRTRVHRQAFSIDGDGLVSVIPCRTAELDEVSPSCEFGELAYLCLTGRTWQEKAIPVRDLAQTPHPLLAELVIELLEGGSDPEEPSSALSPDLAVRLRSIADPAPVPFVPTEAAVPVEEAVTAQLRLDAGYLNRLATPAAAESQVQHPASSPEVEPPGGVHRLRGAARRGAAGSGNRPASARRQGGAQRAARRRSTTSSGPIAGLPARRDANTGGKGGTRRVNDTGRGRWRLMGIGAAVVAVVCGAALLLTPTPDPIGAAVAGPHDLRAPESVPVATVPAESASDQQPPAGRGAQADPVDAFEQLTRQREEAYETGDRELLKSLTVPGSPAAIADESADVEAFTGTEVTITVGSTAAPVVTGSSAVLAVSMQTSVTDPAGDQRDFGEQGVEVELRKDDDGWRVFQVTTTG